MSQLWPLICVYCLSADPVGNGAPPDLEQVRNSYLATVSAIHTLECEVQARSTPKNPQPGSEAYSAYRYQLWKKGALRAVEMEHLDETGRVTSTTWRGFDGRKYSHWSALNEPLEDMEWLPGGSIKAERDALLHASFLYDILTGTEMLVGSQSLGQLFERSIARLEWDMIDGGRCLKISLPRHSRSRHRPEELVVETTVWIDPGQGYLPRQITSLDFANGDDRPPMVWDVKVIDFQRVMDTAGTAHVVPSRGSTGDMMVRRELELSHFVINSRLPDSVFSPIFPPLTKVVESLPNQPKRTRIIGDAAKYDRLMQQRFEAALEHERDAVVPVQTTTTSQLPPDASPAATMSGARILRYLLGLAGVAFCGIGITIWRRKIAL